MRRVIYCAVFMIMIGVFGSGCATIPSTPAQRESSHDSVKNAIALAKEHDPSLVKWFDTARGYAVFPSVGKGGIGIGGAYGTGEVFEKGKRIGYASLTQATIGFQLGGQTYTEIIFFKDKTALDHFIGGNYELGAQASVAAINVGASAEVDYSGGVAVFTLAKGGLMYEASVGGQKFDFREDPGD